MISGAHVRHEDVSAAKPVGEHRRGGCRHVAHSRPGIGASTDRQGGEPPAHRSPREHSRTRAQAGITTLEAGAHAVASGTAFLVAHEADVHPIHVDRLLRATAEDTVLTTVFDVGWPDAPHRVVRNDTYTTWHAAGRPPPGERSGEGEVVATREGSSIVRYSDAQPTRGTAGAIDVMALYAGTSVGHVCMCASAREISEALARALT